MNQFKIILLVWIGVFLFGCVQIEEILYLQKGGKLNWTLNFKLPDMPDQKNKSSFISKKKFIDENTLKALGITYQENNYVRAGVKKIGVSMDLSSPALLKNIYQNIKADVSDAPPDDKKTMESLDGIFSGNNAYQFKQQGDTYTIVRKISLPKPKKVAEKVNKNKDKVGFSKDFGDMFINMLFIRFEIVTDGEIISSNAHERVGNSLRWEASVGGLMREALVLEAKIKIPQE